EKHSSIGVYQPDYALDFSDFLNKKIDTIRVYYTWAVGATQQVYFNLESLTIANASTTPPPPPSTAPTVDANGISVGTSNIAIFTEDDAAIPIVASDATLTDDNNITGM